MLPLFRKILGRRRAPAPRIATARQAPGAPPTADFDTFARVCRLALPGPRPAPSPGDDELAATILEHALANRAGPEAIPALALQILTVVAAPRMDAQKLAALVGQDPAIAATVVRAANSAANRGVSVIDSLRDAIARLGLEEVGRIAGAVGARSLFNPRLRAQ